MVRIVTAQSKEDRNQIRAFFSEYASSLGFDLSFQDFQKELAALPGEYSPLDVCLLLALEGTQVAAALP